MRLYLYRQDIQDLTEESEKTALQIMREIRETHKLPKKRYISVKAYCQYFRVDKDDVYQKLEEIERSRKKVA
jgi:hypothetical protein